MKAPAILVIVKGFHRVLDGLKQTFNRRGTKRATSAENESVIAFGPKLGWTSSSVVNPT
ncbi:MAG: hypothetical protein ACTS4T_01005 [Candidatus Hodgkinia cicadicola]